MPPATDSASKYGPTSWGGELLEDVLTPSGQLCQVRRPGMQGLIANGILDKMDTLTAMVNDQHISRVKGSGKVKEQDILQDPKRLLEILDSVDRVAVYIVVQPPLVRPVKDVDGTEVLLNDDERETGVIYTDMVDMEDKMFLFQYAVGGTRDIARFREQSQQAMGGLGTEQDVAVPA